MASAAAMAAEVAASGGVRAGSGVVAPTSVAPGVEPGAAPLVDDEPLLLEQAPSSNAAAVGATAHLTNDPGVRRE